jgi:hypothetical protein
MFKADNDSVHLRLEKATTMRATEHAFCGFVLAPLLVSGVGEAARQEECRLDQRPRIV